MALATSAAIDTMFAAATNANTASTANVTFAAGVQDAPIVPAPAIACAVATPRRSLAPAIACAVATPRRSSSRVKNVIYQTISAFGDRQEWYQLYNIALKETNEAEKLRILRALTFSKDYELLNLYDFCCLL